MLPAAFAFPFDCAFVSDGQTVLAGDGTDGRHQRGPSMFRFDSVKAEQQAGMKTTSYRAYVSPDSAAVKNHGLVGPDHVLFQFRLKTFSRLDPADIELFLEADQECRAVGDGVVRSERLGVAILIFSVQRRHSPDQRDDQSETQHPARSHSSHKQTPSVQSRWM